MSFIAAVVNSTIVKSKHEIAAETFVLLKNLQFQKYWKIEITKSKNQKIKKSIHDVTKPLNLKKNIKPLAQLHACPAGGQKEAVRSKYYGGSCSQCWWRLISNYDPCQWWRRRRHWCQSRNVRECSWRSPIRQGSQAISLTLSEMLPRRNFFKFESLMHGWYLAKID